MIAGDAHLLLHAVRPTLAGLNQGLRIAGGLTKQGALATHGLERLRASEQRRPGWTNVGQPRFAIQAILHFPDDVTRFFDARRLRAKQRPRGYELVE
jgi:hypothetical protein